MVDHVYDFYGVDNNTFCIGINGSRVAFEAIEDKDDGYRSYLDSVIIAVIDHTYFKQPIAKVRMERRPTSVTNNGWQLVDVTDEHVWLTVGTNNTDNYYPYFTFEYVPKPTIIPEV